MIARPAFDHKEISMRKIDPLFRRSAFFGLMLVGLALAGPVAAEPAHPLASPKELIVLLAHGPGVPTPEEVVESARRRDPLPGGLGVGAPQSARFGLTRRTTGSAREQLLAEPDSPRARLERYLVLSYPAAANLEAISKALTANPFVLSVEENTSASFSVAPNDPLFPFAPNPTQYQWGLHTLNFAAAWDRIKGHAYVGLVDTGLQVDHPDLRAFNPSGGYDGGNFRPHLSWDVQNNDADVDENHPTQTYAGHGTHTSGIIAATPNNGIGTVGGCWRCSLLMGKIGTPGEAFKTEVAEAIVWHVDHGVQVVNMSLGWSTAESQGMVGDALLFANQRDVAMFASSGNDKTDINFPASDPRVVAVGGIEADESLWVEEVCPRPGYSGNSQCGTNYTLTPGTKMQELVAPAQKVLSTIYTGKDWNPALGCGDSTEPNPGYGLCTGTSMSAPHVSALAGLLRSANPLLSKANVRSLLIDNADRAGAWNFQFGYGVPDAALSVEKALGRAAGQILANRLTPLFSLYSSTAEDYLYTSFPQVASAAIAGLLLQNCERLPNGSCSVLSIPYQSVGPSVAGYSQFPGFGCSVSPCTNAPRASVYIFTSDSAPYAGAPPLVPLYRLSFRGTNPANGNPLNRDLNYTTDVAGILAYKQAGYNLDGIEGYIYQRCSPEPSCIPPGAVRLYRLYHAGRDDHAIFPESELAQMQAAGYASEPGANDWIGYVYPNVDSDFDTLIDGFERLAGTNIALADSDCDGASDGTEVLNYPYGDPLSTPGCLTGTGLKGEYFINAQLSGSPALVRTDATIDYDWAAGSPHPTLPVDWFSVRWTGQVQAQYTQTYTFYTRTDDGVRLWVNGQLLIDKWVGQSSTEWSGSINLTAGQLYNITMEYFDGPGSAEARLLWSSLSTPKQVIPSFALFYPGVPPGASGTGLTGEYFNNAQLSGSPALVRTDATVNYDWAGGSPHPILPSDWFSVRWTGLVQAQYTQTYTFYTRTDDGVRLWVNGQLLIDKWVGQSSTEWSGSINLTAGQLYNIKMEYFDGPGSAEARLLWSSPSTPKQVIPQVALFLTPGSGLRGEYFNNAQLSGSPALVRTDPTINYDWASGSPHPTIPVDWFSVRWTGQVRAQYTQNYTFYTRTDDGVRLWVNGQLLIDKWVGQSSTEWSGSINLVADQMYSIKMEYFDGPANAEARLLWSSPSTPKQAIPQGVLYP
jgi:subtilisin family serine protease